MDALLHRKNELSLFREAIGELAPGSPAVITVEGDRGIGKSALLEAVTELLPPQGQLLRARCHPSESGFEYGMVRQLFDPVLGTGRKGAPAFDEARPDGRLPTHEVLLGLLRATRTLSADRPLVLLIDDLSHADPPSLLWFSSIARRLDQLPVLMVATLPSVGSDQLLADLGQLPYLRRIRPEPLCPTCSGDLAERAFDAPVDRELAALCHTLSRGNPRVLGELVGRLRQQRVSPGTPDPAQALAIGSAALSATVLAWLEEDDPEAAELLTQLAVLGPGTGAAVCGALSECGEAQILRARASLVRAGLLETGTPARFPHPALRPAVLARIPAPVRLGLHERAAVVLPRLGAPATETAEHLIQAGCDWGLDVLHNAGAQAAAVGDYEAAARFLRRALAMADGPSAASAETFHELSVRLGAAELHHDLDACVRQAVAIADAPAELALRAHGLARLADPVLAATTTGGRPFARVAGELAALSGPPRGLLLRLGAQALLCGHRAGLRQCARLLALGPQDADAQAFGGALAATAAATGRIAAARRLAVRALDGAADAPEAGRHGTGTTAGAVGASLALIWCGDLERAAVGAGLIVDTARAGGDAASLPLGLLVRAEIAYRRGEFTQALADAYDAMQEADRLGSPALACAGRAAGARALAGLGRAEQAAALLTGATVPADAHPLVKALSLQAHGLVAAARGDHTAAVGLFMDCGHRLALRGITNAACLPWRAHAAQAYLALGERTAAVTIMGGEPLEEGRPGSAGRTAGSPGKDLLTPAESRVVDLIVQGHSSLEVAETLFLSKRTIDTHLGRIYRKLGIRSRHELVAVLGAE